MKSESSSPQLQEIFRKGIQEILPAGQWPSMFPPEDAGEDFVSYVLNQASNQLEPLTACGLFQRSGLAAFKFLIRRDGKNTGLDTLEFRLQPPRQRLMDGLSRLTTLLAGWKTDGFVTGQDGDDITVTITSANKASTPAVSQIRQHFYAGLLQEFLYWAGGGKQYPFEVRLLDGQPAVRILFRLLPVD